MYRGKYDIYEERQGQGDVPFGDDLDLSNFNAPGQVPTPDPGLGQPDPYSPYSGGGKNIGNIFDNPPPPDPDLGPDPGAGSGKSLGNPDDYIVDGYGGAGAQPNPSGPGTLDPGISAVEEDVGGAVESAVDQGAGQSPAGYLAEQMVQAESDPSFRYGYWYGNQQPQTAQAVDQGPPEVAPEAAAAVAGRLQGGGPATLAGGGTTLNNQPGVAPGPGLQTQDPTVSVIGYNPTTGQVGYNVVGNNKKTSVYTRK